MIKIIINITILISLSISTFAQGISNHDILKDSISEKYINKGNLTGGRSKESIMKVVVASVPNITEKYNNRLKQKAGIKGKITVKFAIDEYGKVIFSKTVESTVNDGTLEKEIITIVNKMEFEKIEKPGDITEVIYPFIFAQKSNVGLLISTIFIEITMLVVLLAVITSQTN